MCRLNPSSFYPPSFLRIMRPLRPSIHPSTLPCCFDILSTAVSLFVLGSLGCAVYRMLTMGVTCTQLSCLFCSGCATYPMLVVGVMCTLSSRSFFLHYCNRFTPSC